MRIEPFVPDIARAQNVTVSADSDAFGKVLNDLGGVLGKAQAAEDAFAEGAGDLQTAVYERARADVALSVATAGAQRTAQALQSILNMQV
jgi:flagellar hook-basal body complex protein FliE